MRQVFIKSVRYILSEYAYTNGHKENENDHYNRSADDYVLQEGYGWASEWKPSKMIVIIDDGDGYSEVWSISILERIGGD
jgi:hypothetical protein